MPQADGRQSGSPVRPARSVLTRPTARSDARRVVVDRWRIRISQYQRPLRARRLRRPGFFTFSACSHLTPSEGWMERRQAHSFFLSRLRGATPALVRRGPVPVRPGPLSALHRGDFRPRTHAVVSGSGPPEPQRLPAPGRNCLAVGVRTSRSAVRAAAAGRHSPLRLQDRLRRRPS